MNKKDCKCNKCKGACESKPGWFKPGEPEKVAKYLKISLQELFNSKLMVDWWVDEEDIFLLAPAIKTSTPGKEYPANPRGECVFFKNGLCEIHEVKPFECRSYIHNDQKDWHIKAKDGWNTKKNQEQIEKLLGREPISKSYSLMDVMFG